MNDNSTEAKLEQKLRAAFGSPQQPDFEAWAASHTAAVSYLNPVSTARQHRKRKVLLWAGRALLALAACVLVAVFWKMGGEQPTFAQAIKAAQDAHTVTMKQSFYTRVFSKDGQRSWLKEESPSTLAYRQPGQYRFTEFDPQGNPQWVEIADLQRNKTLQLDLKTKKATWANHSRNQYSPDGPISSTKIFDRQQDVQLVGQREVGHAMANVFRFHLRGDHSSFDVWVDVDSKQLLGYSSPGGDVFDPSTAPDRNNPPEKTFSHGEVAGLITDHIVVNAKLDNALFDMIIPEGFEVIVEPPLQKVSEADMIEYLGTTARFNGGKFGERLRGFDLKQFNQSVATKPADRTDAEQKMIDLWDRHMKNRTTMPCWDFAKEYTEPKSFRYVGEGVKLGDADRIVCWYKLKSTDKWRAVYGDLAVKDVEPKDLPLPVE